MSLKTNKFYSLIPLAFLVYDFMKNVWSVNEVIIYDELVQSLVISSFSLLDVVLEFKEF